MTKAFRQLSKFRRRATVIVAVIGLLGQLLLPAASVADTAITEGGGRHALCLTPDGHGQADAANSGQPPLCPLCPGWHPAGPTLPHGDRLLWPPTAPAAGDLSAHSDPMGAPRLRAEAPPRAPPVVRA